MQALLPAGVAAKQMKQLEQYRSALFRKRFLPDVQPFPNVRELFQLLQPSGRKIVLVSSCRADEIDDYKKIADVAHLVDDQVTSDDAQKSKPSPDLFEAALTRLAPARPEQLLAVGDTPYDAEAAVRAGITAVGLLSGAHSEADLRAAGCKSVYKDPADLLSNWSSAKATALPAAGSHAKASSSIAI
jgi:HAD superfamily hydrolase (TIGR01509 family)